MPHQLFLSHDTRDRERAAILARMISRVSLGQITVWHSSDQSASGGLVPGHVWLDEIRNRLEGSKAVVVLLTPTSLSRPWILFESGFGAAQKHCDVIPVCVGVDRLGDIPFPLAMYQTYQLSDYESLKRFTEKLTAKYEVQFDEPMAQPVLLEAVKYLSQAEGTLKKQAATESELSLTDAVLSLKEHIDKRVIALMSTADVDNEGREGLKSYNVPVNLNVKGKSTTTQYVEIDIDMTVDNVLDHIYFMLDGEVDAYKYLEEWMLKDLTTNERLIVKEIQSRIPARVIFTPGSCWEVVKLDEPYSANE